MPNFGPPVFAADKAGCPTCLLELIRHPLTGRWVCPSCKFERATLHEHVTVVSTRPALAVALKVLSETLDQIRPQGDKVDEQTTPIDEAQPEPEPVLAPPWISVIELASRWGVSVYIATHRLRDHAVPSLRELQGKLVVDRADVARWPTEAPPAKKGGNGAVNGAAIETPKAGPAALPSPSAEPAEPERPAITPEQLAQLESIKGHLDAFTTLQRRGDDPHRVRRLLLVLEHIERLSHTYSDDPWILPAIAALARYALAAES